MKCEGFVFSVQVQQLSANAARKRDVVFRNHGKNPTIISIPMYYVYNCKFLIIINVQEVEREISFRTEQGLYYSYFKQVLV